MFDLILRNARPFYESGCGDIVDIGIKNGLISAVAPRLEGEAQKEFDVSNRLVVPSFVDSHTHLDKVCIGEDTDANGLWDAIRISREYLQNIPLDQAAEDIFRRASQVIDMELLHGTGAIKTHMLFDDVLGSIPTEAMHELKKRYKDKIDLRTIVPWVPDKQDELIRLVKAGMVDFLGGYPTLSSNFRATTDGVFAFAKEYDLSIDMHVDEADEPNIDCFEYVLEQTIAFGMQGRVSAGHVTALCAVDDERAERAILRAKDVDMNIITLPSCNMYLMGRKDHQPIRRGVTRVDEFLKAGVNVAYASDNIRDPYRPFGNGNLLEEGLFCAQVLQYGTSTQLEEIMRMGTYRAAKNMELERYGLQKDCYASLIVLDAASPKSALISQCDCILVLYRGARV